MHGGVLKQIALSKIQSQHKSADSFSDVVGTLVSEFDGTPEASGLKAFVCGPIVSPSPTMYHYIGPNDECRRWVQPVNMEAGDTPPISILAQTIP